MAEEDVVLAEGLLEPTDVEERLRRHLCCAPAVMRMSHRSLVAFGERLSPERSKRQGWYFTQGVNGLFARTYRFIFLAAAQHAWRRGETPSKTA